MFVMGCRSDGDVDFVNAVSNALDLSKTVLFVTLGEEAEGSFFLFGPESLVDGLAAQVSSLLDGKGGGKKGRFQGKCKRLSARVQVEALLRESIAT